MRESVVFYKSFYDAIQELPPEQQANLYNAVFQFQFYGTEAELHDGIEQAMWKIIKPLIIANNERFENGKKGGRPKKEKPVVIKNETIGYENKNHRLSKSGKNENLMSNVVMSNVVMSNVDEEKEKEAPASAPVPKDKVMAFYLNNINPMPLEHEIEILEDYRKQLCDDLLLFAMQKAVENKSRTLKYIKAIWDSWLSKGITTLAEAKEEKRPKKVENSIKYFDSSGQYDDAEQYYTKL